MNINLLHPTITHHININDVAWYYRTYPSCPEPSKDVKILEKYTLNSGDTERIEMVDNSGFKYYKRWSSDNWNEKEDETITSIIKELFDHGWYITNKYLY